jgi:hypothetical protein
MSYRDKLDKVGPRKLLALDGGGIRGVITLEVLTEIERQLQKKFGRGDDFVLADYFDYIGGTSTGAIIAACLPARPDPSMSCSHTCLTNKGMDNKLLAGVSNGKRHASRMLVSNGFEHCSQIALGCHVRARE